jgi:type II secretory ATPase GspE/PulE/Tfp pilus assembly ATPase PilB-like protein
MNPAAAPIGQTLLNLGLISADQLHIALREQGRSGEALGRQLVRLGFLSEATLRDALARTLDRPSADLAHLLPDAEALTLIPQHVAKRLKLIPLSYDAARQLLVIASGEIDNLVALDQLGSLLPPGTQVEIQLAGDSDIARAIDLLYGHELSIDGILHEIETGEPDLRSPSGRAGEYAQPVVRLIDALLTDAVKRDASDIHFEPEAAFLRIRYRIDGCCARSAPSTNPAGRPWPYASR